jgi:hypothetical protein
LAIAEYAKGVSTGALYGVIREDPVILLAAGAALGLVAAIAAVATLAVPLAFGGVLVLALLGRIEQIRRGW